LVIDIGYKLLKNYVIFDTNKDIINRQFG